MANPDSSVPPHPSKRVRPKTYIFAVYLTLGVALIPLLALVSVFWLRHKVRIDTKSPELIAWARQLARDEKTNSPPPPKPAAPPAPAAGSLQPILNPTLAPARLPVPVDPTERITDLDQEAYGYMQQGENDLAKVTLLEAENIDPKDLRTLRYEAELAEVERDWSRASDYWQRILDLGDAAGETAAVARQRLAAIHARLANPSSAPLAPLYSPPPQPAAASSPTPAANPAAIASPSPAPVAAATNTPVAAPAPESPASVATPGTPIFRVDSAQSTSMTDNPANFGFVLRIPIAPAVPGTPIDPGKIGIKLYFYDQVNGGTPVPTNAKLQVAFESPRPSWSGGRTETLRAVYQRSAASTNDQKYYGYIFRLFYDGVLQDERSDPAALLSLFPNSP